MSSKTFILKDIPLSVVNGIRRTVLNGIPNVAANASSMDIKRVDGHMEFIKHRITLVPMHFNEKEIENFNPNNYRFVLSVKNTSIDNLSVTSKDIEIYNPNNGEKYPPNFHARIFPANKISKDHVLITRLHPNNYNMKEGETIHIEFSAEKNIAKQHVCFMPVSKCSFYYQIDEEAASNARKQSSNPKQFDIHDRFRHFKKNDKGEPNEFVFSIDSECALSPTYLINKALQIIKERLITLVYTTNNLGNNYWEIIINKEDSSIGNMINSSMFDRMKSPLSFVGYYSKHHQLVEQIVIKMGFDKEMKEREVNDFFDKEVDHLVNNVLDISLE
jgi:DNA-directed RNA polymerase alpha subunit